MKTAKSKRLDNMAKAIYCKSKLIIYYSLVLLFSLGLSLMANAQGGPPAPCTDGNQPTCACETAPILCTVDELDGYEYSMTTFQHPSDGPSPLCSAGGVPDNPTWFSFIAWCSDLQLMVTLSNCTNMCGDRSPCGTGFFPCGIFGGPCSFGVQAVVYASCNYTGEVACVVDECGENQFLINMTALEVGGTYHLILDGCNGSACDVRINVVGVCGSAAIEPWSNPIEGPTHVCLGDSPTYTVDNLQAASNYHWYIDGQEVAITSTPFYAIDWPGVGTYELCVDASNDPCIPVENEPGQICMTVTVGVVDPIDPDPVEICSGEEYFFPPDGTSYGPGQYTITLTSVAGCDSIITLNVLAVEVQDTDLGVFYLCGGEAIEVGGSFYSLPGFYPITLQQDQAPFCDSLVSFFIEPQFTDAGNFTNIPTTYCPGEVVQILAVNYAQAFYNLHYLIITDANGWVVEVTPGGFGAFTSNECQANFTIYSYNVSIETDFQTPSIGDFFDLNYCISDCCDIIALEIAFEDVEPPIFTNPPQDITLASVEELEEQVPELSWTDNCGEFGASQGAQTGESDPCEGGLFERTWEAVDACGNRAVYIQSITIAPDPDACIDPCTIEVQNLIVGDCNNNDTGFDETDDFFDISFEVTILEGSGTNYIIIVEGDTLGPFEYEDRVTLDSLSATGNVILIELLDNENPACQTSFEVVLDPCSACEQTVDAGEGGTLTCAERTIQLIGSSSEPGVYSWTGPDGFVSNLESPTVDRPGEYILTVFFDAGCFFSDEVFVVEEVGIPNADAGNDARLDCNIRSLQIGGSGTSMVVGVRYQWTDQFGNIVGDTPFLDVDLPGAYTLRVIDDNSGCESAPSTVFVTENVSPPDATIIAEPSTQLDCKVAVINLTPLDQGELSLTWVVNGVEIPAAFLEIASAGTIQLLVLNEDNGCSNESEITITASFEHPEIEIFQPEAITCMDTISNILATITPENDLLIFWTRNGMLLSDENSFELWTNQEGVYTITVENVSNGCVSSEQVEVIDLRELIEVDAGQDLSFSCLDTVETIRLMGTVQELQPNWTITWTTGAGNILNTDNPLSPVVAGSGVYILTVENETTGCRGIDSVRVVLNQDAPRIRDYSIVDIFCEGDIGSIALTDFDSGTLPFEILLNQIAIGTSGMIENLGPGDYTLQIIDALGCEDQLAFSIRSPSKLDLSIVGETFLEPGDTTFLEGVVSIPIDSIGFIQWTPEIDVGCDTCLVTTAFPTTPTTFRLYVEDINGCFAEDSLFIFLRRTLRVFIPNAFTPNGDGVNDFFTLFSDERIVAIRFLEIFDRWGSMVFRQEKFPPNEPDFGWNGSIKNERGQPGTYIYHFNVERDDGVFQSYSGEVILLR